MTTSEQPDKYGVTPTKLVLIGVLSVVLIGVVYLNFFRDDATENVAPSQPTDAKETTAAGAADKRVADDREKSTSDPDSPSDRPAWPKMTLASIIRHDPLALPPSFPQPQRPSPENVVGTAPPATAAESRAQQRAQQAAELAAIREQGVNFIYKQGSDFVARIGERDVRVGDRIAGLRVVDISVRGVKLQGE